MRMSKADIAREGAALGVDFSPTVSCYQADGEGRACGHCDACRLRAQGFREPGCPIRPDTSEPACLCRRLHT